MSCFLNLEQVEERLEQLQHHLVLRDLRGLLLVEAVQVTECEALEAVEPLPVGR